MGDVMLKITGGIFRGRYIKTLKNWKTRYTSSRIRLALFSIIGDDIEGASFLELFSGSGIVSIEALSRGAELATLVDISKRAIKCAMENIKMLGLDEKVELLNMDFRRAVSYLAQSGRKYDVIFADPPYNMGYCEILLKDLLDNSDILKPNAIVILEHHKKEKFKIPSGFMYRSKNFGDTKLLILNR